MRLIGCLRQSRRRARIVGIFGACVMAVIGLSACSAISSTTPSSSSSSGGKGVTNVVYWNMWSGQYASLIQKLVNQFNAAHPTIHVQMLTVPEADGDAKLLSAIAAGEPPDVFTEWNPEIGTYASTGAIQSLNKYETGQYKGLASWMYPVAAQWGSYNGQLYGLPMSMSNKELYYNKTILKSIGVSAPPTTFAQLMSDQAKAWKISGSRVQQIGFYPPGDSWDAFTCGFNSNSYTGGQYNLASSAGAKAEMNFMAEFKQYSYSAVNGFTSAYGSVSGGSENPFDMGKQAFDLNGPWVGADDIPQDDPGMQFGVVPMPTPPGGGKTGCSDVWGNYNVIPKGAKNPAAAWTFMTWMAGYDNAAWAAKTMTLGAWLPPSAQIAAQPAFKNWLAANPYLNVFSDGMNNAGNDIVPVSPHATAYENALTTAVQDVETGTKSPSQALSYIDSQGNNS
jgi:multiple sugar transport system substrate-binding protein